MKIVISGVSSGIGREAAIYFASRGDTVYGIARRKERLDELHQQYPNFIPCVGDVGEELDITHFVELIKQDSSHVDAVICCAGAFGAIGSIETVDANEWWQSLKVNLFGTFLLIKHCVPLLQDSLSPRIITFAGGGAFQPFPNYSAYAVSKAGCVRLTETLAQELTEKGICVNAIAPGFVATEIHNATIHAGVNQSGKEHFEITLAKLEEGAIPMEVPIRCLSFLLSDKAAGLTGKTISASFDPWDTPEFADSITQLNDSDLYTMQRINIKHLHTAVLKTQF